MYNIDRVIKIANYVSDHVPASLNFQPYQKQYGGQRKNNLIQV